MDFFEQIVARMLESRGYWVRTSFRVDLTKQDKRDLDKPSLPRPEIDLIAFNPKQNVIVLFEIKSYLDSQGVTFDAVALPTVGKGRFKILTDAKFQTLIAKRVVASLVNAGLVASEPRVQFGLAAGKVVKSDLERVAKLARERDWVYLSPPQIGDWVRSLAHKPYENDPVVLAAKLSLRGISEPKRRG